MPSYGILPEEQGHGLMSWEEAAERFSRCRNYWLSTVRPDGRPHAVPIWGVWLDTTFYFSTSVSSVKAANLAANPNCVVTTDDGEEPVIVEGVAAEETSGAVLERFVAVYKEKYDWDMDPDTGGIFAVSPSKAFAFIENADEFASSATRWRFR
jgi:nitroimidazol reductase NimA-like FMN-containing flavoprotein (pyridoxamine 5'-phosphate oxidase superfamily)